jgi:hypothetical protein
MHLYRLLADTVAVIHFAYAAFLIVGWLLIVLGIFLRWGWVRNFWFRIVHLLMMAYVAMEALFDIICPMFDWEERLRDMAGETIDNASFIGRWAHDFFNWGLTPEMSRLIDGLFFLAIVLVFIFVPPRWPWKLDGYK